MSKNLTLIDADSLCYQCGNTETLSEAIVKVDERINNIVSNTNADYISLFISKGKYFRHDIFSEYKGNRTTLPKWMRSLKSYLEDKYKANWMPKVEADDLVAYWMNKELFLSAEDVLILDNEDRVFETIKSDLNLTMSTIDKDLFYSIPGKHWNYTFRKEDKTKEESPIIEGWWVKTSNKTGEIERFFMEQLLLGDNSDNVLGCGQRVEKIYKSGKKEGQKYMARVGIAAKEAGKMIEKIEDNVDYCIQDTFAAYIGYFGDARGVYEFQKNYRLLHMLNCDEDFMREIGKIPEFPNIIKIDKIEEDEVETVF